MSMVAFLQNQWFKNPERIKATITRTVEREAERGGRDEAGVREFYIASFLFMGCLTGRRLRATLGEDLCDEIVWEEVSREIGGKASSCFPADLEHMRDVLARHRPQIIIGFGALARDALRTLDLGGARLVIAPHPASRSPAVVADLRAAALQINALRRPAP